MKYTAHWQTSWISFFGLQLLFAWQTRVSVRIGRLPHIFRLGYFSATIWKGIRKVPAQTIFRTSYVYDIGTMLNRSLLLKTWKQQHSESMFSCKERTKLIKFWQGDMTRDSYIRFLSDQRTIWTFLPCCEDPVGRRLRMIGRAWCPTHRGG
jgi:hypothetical protein